MEKQEQLSKRIETIKIFISQVLEGLQNQKYDTPVINFVFDTQDIEEINRLLNQKYPNDKSVEKGINILKKVNLEHQNKQQEDAIYIIVKNYIDFFQWLDRIVKEYNKTNETIEIKVLVYTIWLRVGSNDISNINTFLKRQYNFMQNDNFFESQPTVFKEFKNYQIVYNNQKNNPFYETNRKIQISIAKKNNSFNDSTSTVYYDFPYIHYGLALEDNTPVCYIYGIQDYENRRKDSTIKESLREERKGLRNPYVSPELVLSLAFFIALLASKGITKIKVPLLQVGNYDFHKNISDKLNDELSNYTEEEIEELEQNIKENKQNQKTSEYLALKEISKHYLNKEDIISKNKTERLIHTFMVMNEKYNNIEITNAPFIEDDTLTCNIIRHPEKVKNSKK